MDNIKIELLKKIIAKQLADPSIDAMIQHQQEIHDSAINTPADEYSFSGNIAHGITNLTSVATGSIYPVAYLNSKKNTLQEILDLLNADINTLEKHLVPDSETETEDDWMKDLLDRLDVKEGQPKKKHFFECKLTDGEWGDKDCICPGAYVYRKYLSIGLTKEDAKLIANYNECFFEDEGQIEKAKNLYEKHKFLKINNNLLV